MKDPVFKVKILFKSGAEKVLYCHEFEASLTKVSWKLADWSANPDQIILINPEDISYITAVKVR